MKIGAKTLGKLYVLTLTLTLLADTITKISTITIPWYYTYFHCAIWIFIYALLLRKSGKHFINSAVVKSRNVVIHIFSMPYLMFFFLTVLGWVIYIDDISLHNLARALSNNIRFLIYLGTVIATATIFKEKLFNYTFTAMSISYVFTIAAAIASFGIVNFIQTGLLPFGEAANTFVEGGNASSVLEVHDLTFAAGFYIIYYIMWESGKRDWSRIVWCAVLIYLGYKRIQLAALLLITIAAMFISRRSKKGVAYWSVFCTVGALVVMYAYISFIDSGFLSELAEQNHVNFMGRLQSYNIMSRFFTFSPIYIGRGMGSGMLLNAEQISAGMRLIQGHSDILYNYIDFGFFGFTVWIFYCFYFATRYIRFRCGPNTTRLWLLFTIYAFITYLTDNTTSYFAFQSCYMIVMFQTIYKDQVIGQPVGVTKEDH